MRKFVFCIILGTLSWGCTSQKLPPCLQAPKDPLFQRMVEVIEMEKKSAIQEYYFEDSGTIQEQEQQWASIRQMENGSWLQLSLVNIFEASPTEKEYYVEEARLNPSDSSRQRILHFQFIINPDTAYRVTSSNFACRFTGYQQDGLYLLEGYAHEGDPYVSQYRWWSPQFGDVITWYGNSRYLIQKNAKLASQIGNLKASSIGPWNKADSSQHDISREVEL